MAILPGFIPPLFETEKNPIRFERVCLALYRAAEGVTLVPTSSNYDLGRDGRTIGLSSRDVDGILCATLSVSLDDKVRSDIHRLLKTTTTNAIIYCTARSLTEQACDEIEQLIRAEYPSLTAARVLSQVQLVALAQDHDEVLLENYPGEIANLQQTLLLGDTDTAALNGLRLALTTAVGDDASELRTSLLERLVLEVLAENNVVGVTAIAAKLASQLHLPRTPSSAFVEQALIHLEVSGSVVRDSERWTLTDVGREKLLPGEAPAQRLLEGRALIRAAIVELTGKVLTDQMFNHFWDRFQAAITDTFQEHGLAIIQSIRAIWDADTSDDSISLRQMIEHLAQRTTSGFTSPEQREEVRQAVIDIFSEGNSPAFKWLVEVCSVYVMLCSLGLEARSARQISDSMKALTLVPDSDIILSLLCEGEKNHVEVERIIRGWQALSGKVSVATPVLIEMAHHAWIAPHDYTATQHLFSRLADVDAERIIQNAFVRSYWRMSNGKAVGRHWQAYIRDYRGTSETDYSRVARVLQEEYNVDMFPEYIEPTKTPDSDSFQAKLSRFILNRLADDFETSIDELDYRAIDKALRDAQFLANICEARHTAGRGHGNIPVVVSSARILRQAAITFSENFGPPEAVISLPAVATLLAITPGVQLGLGSLRAVLFDVGLSRRLAPLHRLAYRVIAASDLYAFPYSRRGTLRRRLTEQVLSDARKRAKPPAQVEQELLNRGNEEAFARTVLTALDKMAISPSVAKAMRQQQEEIEALQAEVRQLRESQVESSAPPE